MKSLWLALALVISVPARAEYQLQVGEKYITATSVEMPLNAKRPCMGALDEAFKKTLEECRSDCVDCLYWGEVLDQSVQGMCKATARVLAKGCTAE